MEDYVHIEVLKSKNQDEDGEEFFWEAFEEFPFYDGRDNSDLDMSSSSIITLDSEFKQDKSSPASLRRRRINPSDTDAMDCNGASSLVSFREDYVVYRGEKFESFAETEGSEAESENFRRNLERPHAIKLNLNSQMSRENGNDEMEVKSGINYANSARVHDFLLDDIWSVREAHDARSSFLTVLAGLVLKAIEYQLNLLISFFKFPVWLSSISFMFVMDPFTVMKQGGDYLIENAANIWSSMIMNFPADMYELFRGPQTVGQLVLKFVWGFLWSAYVGVVLLALLVSAFIMGGIIMRIVVEEPIKMKEKLDFDYTGKSPMEFVPIIACSEACYGIDCSQKLEASKLGGARVIPPEHKLQITVSLTLPESDYNRNLGIFQVRVDFLAADGKVLASSRHPSMLQFRSEPIRFLLTFLKLPPILYGLASETQDLKIKFKGFTEAAATPTACLRVTIERAEFQPGAGIPEIHSASLILESEQPGLKRIIWNWRRTLFVWVSTTIFTTELLAILLCCSPILIPRVKLRGNSARNGPSRNANPSF